MIIKKFARKTNLNKQSLLFIFFRCDILEKNRCGCVKEFIHNSRVSAKFYKGNGFKILLLIITTIIIMGLRIVTPILSAKTIVYLTDNKLKQVVFVALIILVIDIVWDLFWYLQRQLYHLVYRNVVNKVQDELGREILKISNKSLDANSSGLFIQRLVALQMFLNNY